MLPPSTQAYTTRTRKDLVPYPLHAPAPDQLRLPSAGCAGYPFGQHNCQRRPTGAHAALRIFRHRAGCLCCAIMLMMRRWNARNFRAHLAGRSSDANKKHHTPRFSIKNGLLYWHRGRNRWTVSRIAQSHPNVFTCWRCCALNTAKNRLCWRRISSEAKSKLGIKSYCLVPISETIYLRFRTGMESLFSKKDAKSVFWEMYVKNHRKCWIRIFRKADREKSPDILATTWFFVEIGEMKCNQTFLAKYRVLISTSILRKIGSWNSQRFCKKSGSRNVTSVSGW